MSRNTHILDDAFLQSFRRGEETAFDQVFRAYHVPLTFFANKFVQDEVLAEDLVQECFAQLWERRRKLENVQLIKAYLYRCVFNLCQKLPKHQRRFPNIATASNLEEIPEVIPDNWLLESEVLAAVMRVVDELPTRMQQVVRLYFLEEKSLADIGQELGIDPETVRSHRYHAIRLIRKKIITG